MTTATMQQRARGFIQNITIILLALLAVVAVYYYFFQRTIAPIREEKIEIVQVDPVPAPVIIASEHVVFQDTFEVALDSWETSVAGQALYDRGALILNNKFEDEAFARPHLVFDNFVLNVHTRWLGGAVGGLYGIRFRMQDTEDYYAFYLSNEGRYQIGKSVSGTWISEGSFSEAIALGGSLNLIQIEARESTLRFFVNGHYIGDLTDVDLGAGDIALVAQKSGETNNSFVVAFDNLTVARYPN